DDPIFTPRRTRDRPTLPGMSITEDHSMKRTLFALFVAVFVTESALAQDTYAPVVPFDPTAPVLPVQAAVPPVVVPTTPAPVLPTTPLPSSGPRFRGSAEYLLWFLEKPRVPTPLILSNTNTAQDLSSSFAAGSLADPNSTVLFGGHGVGPSTYSG